METRVWRLKQKRCDITPENPEGFPYVTEALGYRAELIMKGYEPEILGTEIYKKWLEKKKECRKNTLIGA